MQRALVGMLAGRLAVLVGVGQHVDLGVIRVFLILVHHVDLHLAETFRERDLRRGRPGLTGKTRRTYRRGYPAANSLSRIFVRIGYRLNGLPYTIPDSMPGSLDCAARELQSPGYSVDTVTNATMPQAVDGLRNSSTTVMRRMLASIKSVEEVLGGGLLLLRH